MVLNCITIGGGKVTDNEARILDVTLHRRLTRSRALIKSMQIFILAHDTALREKRESSNGIRDWFGSLLQRVANAI